MRDCFEAIEASPAWALIFVDPPYLADKSKGALYASSASWGMQAHERLRDVLVQRERWILCHQACPQIHKLYKDYHIVEYYETAPWQALCEKRAAKDGLKRSELLILSPWVAKRLPPEARNATAPRAFRTWRCPVDGCLHAVTAWTDSRAWCVGRGLHLKRVHSEWCVEPCPGRCKNGCSVCIASWLLQDSTEPAQSDLVEAATAEKDKTGSAESSLNHDGMIWSCPVPSCNYVARVTTEANHWPSDHSRRLKEAHPTWCISPCPQNCAQGCSSCVAVGLLKDPMLNSAAPAGHNLSSTKVLLGAHSSRRAGDAMSPFSSARKRLRWSCQRS